MPTAILFTDQVALRDSANLSKSSFSICKMAMIIITSQDNPEG